MCLTAIGLASTESFPSIDQILALRLITASVPLTVQPSFYNRYKLQVDLSKRLTIKALITSNNNIEFMLNALQDFILLCHE